MNPMKTRVRRGITLTMAYLVIALVMTEPLLFNFSDFAMAGLEDGSMSVWNLWWMKYSVMDLGQSPFHTNYLFYPDGASLTFHSMPKVQGLVGIPLQYLAGLTVAYNIILLLTFVLTALATYWLVYHLLGERLPAFVAGVLFAFCPARWGHLGHSQLLATMLIPVYILFVIKGREALEEGGRRPWIWFSLAGLVLAMTAYDTEYYAVFLLMFSALYFIFYVPLEWKATLFRRWSLLLVGLTVAGTVFAVLFSPMLLAAKREIAGSGDFVTFPASWSIKYSADVLSFFVPNMGEYLGKFFRFAGAAEVTFLGWLAMILAVAGIVAFRRRRDTWLWVMTALLFGVLALGPKVRILGKVTSIDAPYLVLTRVPVLNSVRVPSRFVVIIMLAVSLLAAYGCSALFSTIRRRGWGSAAVPLAAAVILLGIYIEFKPLYLLSCITSPPVYSEIAASDMPGSVITLPMGWEAGGNVTTLERTYTELFQIDHKRPILGGMLARAPKELVFQGIYTPVVDFLADPVQLTPSDPDRDPAAIARYQERYDVAFIVAHKLTPTLIIKGEEVRLPSDLTPEALEKVDKYVTGYLGMEKFAETDEIIAWRRQ
ncbi:MAG: hypothetical protein ACYC4D_09180 [Thermoleophilia bacterium]